MIRHTITIVSLVLLVVLQTTVLSQFETIANNVNIFLLAIMFFLLATKLKLYFVWTIILGVLADMYSGLGFGVITISLLITASVAYLLYISFFSHRTSLSLVLLVSVMTVIYTLSISILSFIYFWLNAHDITVDLNAHYLLYVFEQTVYTSIAFVILYLLFNSVIKQFRERFIISRT